MNLGDRAAVFLATGAMIGFMPKAPGTFGSLLGIPVAFALSGIPLAATVAVLVVLAVLAAMISGRAERVFACKDPGRIVIDEVVGMAVTLAGLPFNLLTVCAGFALFRCLDIVKPPPVRWIDRRLRGGWGVVMDDVAAGIMANVLLRIGTAVFLG